MQLTLQMFLILGLISVGSKLWADTCSTTIDSRDADGNPVDADIVSFQLHDSILFRVLAGDSPKDGVYIQGKSVFLPKKLIAGAKVDLSLLDKNNNKAHVTISLIKCNQTFSVVFGENDSGNDVVWSMITGQLAGCNCLSDMWLRAIPMFGAIDNPSWTEAKIEAQTCKFEIHVNGFGTRQILIIGKGRTTIGTYDSIFKVGGDNSLGMIEFSRQCKSAGIPKTVGPR
jgi:thiamine phosphate synthase YjbQ (UPF0047 family)